MSTLQQLIDRAASSNEVLAVLIAALLSSLGWLALRISTGRAKIVWAFSHQHAFCLQNNNPPVLAYTKDIWVQNVGRVIAEGVEVILPARPLHFDVWPQRHLTQLSNPDGSLSLKFDNLNSREYVTLSVFQTNVEPPNVANIRWCGGVGRQVPMGAQQSFPKWYLSTLRLLLLFGIFSILYFCLVSFGHSQDARLVERKAKPIATGADVRSVVLH